MDIEQKLRSLREQYTTDPQLSMYGADDFHSNLVSWYDAHLKRSPLRWDDSMKAEFVYDVLDLVTGYYGDQLISSNLIDVGCGSGCALEVFEKKSNERIDLYGIDFSQEGIVAAKERTNAALVADDYISHQYDRTFSFVTSLGVFEHFSDPLAAFLKTYDILTDDGLAYVEVPSFDSGRSNSPEGFGRPASGRQLMWQLDKSTYKAIIDATGLKVVMDLQYINPHGYFSWLLAKPTSVYVRKSVPVGLSFELWNTYWLRPRVSAILPDFIKKPLKILFR